MLPMATPAIPPVLRPRLLLDKGTAESVGVPGDDVGVGVVTVSEGTTPSAERLT